MERRDVYLLLSRIACSALAFASFFLRPVPNPGTPMLRAFMVMKASLFLEMLMSLMFLGTHVASLRNWLAPEDHFMYPFVFFESVLAAMQWGSAGAAFGVMIDHRYSQSCSDEHEAVCRRLMISSILALISGCLGVANTLVLLVARLRSNGPRFLEMLMAML